MKLKIVALSFAMLSPNAFSMNGTGIINIDIKPSCSIENSIVDLGDYTPNDSRVISAPIRHECSTGVSYKINISPSDKMTGDVRHLKSTTNGVNDTFQYYLYKNSSKEHWGNSDNSAIKFTGTGDIETSNIFIETIPGQYITPGVYKDTLTMTLSY